jgi:hypothetical protein
MLAKIAHRGPAGSHVVEAEGATLGVVWAESQRGAQAALPLRHCASDEAANGRLAEAEIRSGRLVLTRD